MSPRESLRSDVTGPETRDPPSLMWGPLTRFGLVIAAIVALADQALKLWLLFVVRPAAGRGSCG